MYIFGLFWSYLFYFVLFVCFYFSIEKFFLWQKFQNPRRPGLVEDFIFGIIIGTVTLLCQLIITIINQAYYLPLFISTAVLMTIFKNYIKALIAFIPGFINYLFISYKNDEIYLTIVFALAIILIINYAKTFLLQKYLPVAYFLLLGLWFIFSLLTTFFGLDWTELEKILSQVALIYLFTIIGYFLMWYLVSFVDSSRVLHNTSRYQFLNFFRPAIAVQSLNDFLITNKISYGYLVLFRLQYSKDYAKYIENETGIDIAMHFYKLLQSQVLDKGIVFSRQSDEHGFFMPASRADLQSNMLSQALQKIVQTFNSRHLWNQDEIPLKVTTNFGVSKYGVDSQSVSKLLSYATFALNDQPPSDQTVTFFDWKIYKSFLLDNHLVNSLDRTFQLDNLTKTFTPLYDLAQNRHFATYTNVSNLSNLQTYETVRESLYIKNFQNVFDRYYASDFLLQARNQKLLVYYAPTIFEDQFLLARFCDFFARHKIKLAQVFFVFDARGLNYVKNHALVKKTIAFLRKAGLKIVVPCSYPKTKLAKIASEIDYTFVEGAHFRKFKNNYPTAKLICFDITTPQQVVVAFQNQVQVFGGPLFSQEFNFLKFSKQSKMYLENIIKGVKRE